MDKSLLPNYRAWAITNATMTDATVRGTEIEAPFRPRFANTRQQQLKEIAATGEIELSDKEKKNAQNVAIAVSSLALTIAGTSYPLLGLLSVPGLIYLSLEVVRYCYDYIFKEFIITCRHIRMGFCVNTAIIAGL